MRSRIWNKRITHDVDDDVAVSTSKVHIVPADDISYYEMTYKVSISNIMNASIRHRSYKVIEEG